MKIAGLILGVTIWAITAMAQQQIIQGCVGSDSNSGYTLRDVSTGKTYKLRGAEAQVEQNVGHEVTAVGFVEKQEFEVKSVSSVASTCTLPSQSPIAATGKIGNEGDVIPVTSSASAGITTPGVETQAGRAQSPGDQTNLSEGGSKPASQPRAAPGAPVPAEQIGQNPASAERIASSAERAEINNSRHQLGVNAQPNYSQSAQQQTARANQAAKTGPASSPALTGCLTNTRQGYGLREEKSGATLRLTASGDMLKDHVNHLVEVTGKQSGAGKSSAVAGVESGWLQVTGIRDLAPTCSAHAGR